MHRKLLGLSLCLVLSSVSLLAQGSYDDYDVEKYQGIYQEKQRAAEQNDSAAVAAERQAGEARRLADEYARAVEAARLAMEAAAQQVTSAETSRRNLVSRREALSQRIEDARARRDDINRHLNRVEEELRKLQHQLERAEREWRERQDVANTRKAMWEEKDRFCNAKMAERDQAKKDLEGTRTRLVQARANIQSWTAELSQALTRISQLETTILSMEEMARTDAARARDKIREADAKKLEAEQWDRKVQEILSDPRLVQLEQQLADVKRRVGAKQQELAGLQATLDARSAQVTQLSGSLQQVTTRIDDQNTAIQNDTSLISAIDTQLSTLAQQIAAQESKIASLKQQSADAQASGNAKQQEARDLLNRIKEVQNDPGLPVARQKVTGAQSAVAVKQLALDNVQRQNQPALEAERRALGVLQEATADKDRAAQQVESIGNAVLLLRNQRNALNGQIAPLNVRIQELEKSIADNQALAKAKAEEAQKLYLQARQANDPAERARLNALAKAAEEEARKAQAAAQGAQQEQSQKTQERNRLAQQRNALNQQLAGEEAKLQTVQRLLASATIAYDKAAADSAQAKQAADTARANIRTAKQAVEAAQQNLATAQAELKALEDRIAAQVATLTQQAKAASDAATAAYAEVQRLNTQITAEQNRLAGMRLRPDKLTQERAACQQRIATARAALPGLEQEKSRLTAALATAQNDAAVARAAVNTARQQLSTLQSEQATVQAGRDRRYNEVNVQAGEFRRLAKTARDTEAAARVVARTAQQSSDQAATSAQSMRTEKAKLETRRDQLRPSLASEQNRANILENQERQQAAALPGLENACTQACTDRDRAAEELRVAQQSADQCRDRCRQLRSEREGREHERDQMLADRTTEENGLVQLDNEWNRLRTEIVNCDQVILDQRRAQEVAQQDFNRRKPQADQQVQVATSAESQASQSRALANTALSAARQAAQNLAKVQENMVRGLAEAVRIGTEEGKAHGGREGSELGQPVGYQAGLPAGRQEGQTRGIADGEARCFKQGSEEGRPVGVTEGKAAGTAKGAEEGQVAGARAGETRGREDGFLNGRRSGYQKGLSTGDQGGQTSGTFEEGFNQGYAAGDARANAQAVKDDYPRGLQDANDHYMNFPLTPVVRTLGEELSGENVPAFSVGYLTPAWTMATRNAAAIAEMGDGTWEGPNFTGQYYNPSRTFPHHRLAETYKSSYHNAYYTGAQAGYDEARQRGYQTGYQEGWNQVYPNYLNQDYPEKRAAGRKASYDAGYQEVYQPAYQVAYKGGYDGAYLTAYNQVLTVRFEEGEKVGYEEGYRAGFAQGSAAARQRGLAEGEKKGFDEKYPRYKKSEYDRGYAEREGYFRANALPSFQKIQVADANGNGIFEPGEKISFAVQIYNYGVPPTGAEIVFKATASAAGLTVGADPVTLPAVDGQTATTFKNVGTGTIAETVGVGTRLTAFVSLTYRGQEVPMGEVSFVVANPYEVVGTGLAGPAIKGREIPVIFRVKNLSDRPSILPLRAELTSSSLEVGIVNGTAEIAGFAPQEVKEFVLSFKVDRSSSLDKAPLTVKLTAGSRLVGQKDTEVKLQWSYFHTEGAAALILTPDINRGEIMGQLDTLGDLGMAADAWDFSRDGAVTQAVLQQYPVVWWEAGQSTRGDLVASSLDALKQWTAGGGRLVFSASYPDRLFEGQELLFKDLFQASIVPGPGSAFKLNGVNPWNKLFREESIPIRRGFKGQGRFTPLLMVGDKIMIGSRTNWNRFLTGFTPENKAGQALALTLDLAEMSASGRDQLIRLTAWEMMPFDLLLPRLLSYYQQGNAAVDELLSVVMSKIHTEVLHAQENRNGDTFVLHADATCLSRLAAFATAEGKPLKPKLALGKKQLADWSGKLGKKDREVYGKLITQLY